MISTKKKNLLPDRYNLQKICKSIAVLDAILSQEWEYRYYSYNSKWADGEEFFEMRNGGGDQMLILFRNDGCVINGFAHELYDFEEELPSKQKLTNQLPQIFNEFVFGEPVNSIGTTFCIWTTEPKNWQVGQIDYYDDGSKDILYIFDGNPQTYLDWAKDYYDKNNISIEVIKSVYKGEKLTKKMVLSITDTLDDWKLLESDLIEISYPYDFS